MFNKIPCGVYLTDAKDSRSSLVYSKIIFEVHVARRPSHYVWSLIIPFMMLTLALFAAVAPVSWEHVGERQLNTVALLFSGVGLRFVMRESLPDA